MSYETIRQWCWYLDELFVNLQGHQQYLWRAVDQDGDVIDTLVQPRRDRHAAERFFRKLLKGQGRAPRRLITDKLRSYAAAHGRIMPAVVHSTTQTKTIGPNSRINQPANASARCDGSNPPRTE